MDCEQISVLLVVDSPSEADRICSKLTHAIPAPVKICHVRDVVAGLPQIANGDCDIAVLSLDAAEPDCVNAMDEIHKMSADFPIVLLTAGDNRAEVDRIALQFGAQDCLLKNTDGKSLARSLIFAIERCRHRKLQTKTKQIEQRLVAMQDAINIVAHELRTPLGAMRLSAELLLDATLIDTGARRNLKEIIYKETNRLTEMVDNLLVSASIKSGARHWQWSEINLQAVTNHVADLLSPMISVRQVRLTTSVQPAELTMRGDHDAMIRLLINIVGNALKYTRCGGIDIDIRSVSINHEEWIQITVSDTGSGISRDGLLHLGHAFNLSTPPSVDGCVQGAGLGLSICRMIAAAHGGRISVSSKPGVGSRFCTTLRKNLIMPESFDEHLPEIQVQAWHTAMAS